MAVALASIALAWLTYELIERPIRLCGHGKFTVARLAVLMGAIGCCGWTIFERDGLSFRRKDREAFVTYFDNSYPQWRYFKRVNLEFVWRMSECGFFDTNTYLKEGRLEGNITDSKPKNRIDTSCYLRDLSRHKAVLIWGDSHAQALAPGIVNSLPRDWQVLQVASSACPPDPSVELPSTTSQCQQTNYFAIKTIREAKPDVVVVAQGQGHSAKAMRGISAKVERLGVKKILFIGPTPHWRADLPRIMARLLWLTKPRRTHIGLDQQILSTNNQLLRDFTETNKSTYVDVIDVFCNKDGCLTYTGVDMRESLTAWDYGHLTPSASLYLAQNRLVKLILGN